MTNFAFSEDIKRRAERIISGVIVKYHPEVHIPLLLALFMDGKDIAAFCAGAEIGRITFFDWVKKHKAFAAAYEDAQELARQFYERIGVENYGNPTFNSGLWALNMRNRFGYTNERKLKIAKLKAAKTFNDQYDVVRAEVSEGNLTPSEADKMVKMVATGCDIHTKTDLELRVGNLEKDREKK
jgi:hypothetical protein